MALTFGTSYTEADPLFRHFERVKSETIYSFLLRSAILDTKDNMIANKIIAYLSIFTVLGECVQGCDEWFWILTSKLVVTIEHNIPLMNDITTRNKVTAKYSHKNKLTVLRQIEGPSFDKLS